MHSPLARSFARAAGVLVALAALLVFPRSAHAYAWMIRHDYGGCMPCHADPSGAGALTPYGRAQGDLLLRTPYGPRTEEAATSAGFLWDSAILPDALRLGGDLREAWLTAKSAGAPSDARLITMRADLYGDAKLGRFRAAGSIGLAPTGARAAALTRAPTDNLVSRDHWIGVELDDDGAFLLRAGRMALPFGIRNVEHTLWARQETRTGLNDMQQHGVALAFQAGPVRGEIMGIAGNFQVRPDDFRERGYSAYVEGIVAPRIAVGASSLFTRATRDVVYRVTNYRQAHGLFLRGAPIPSLVILAEADWTYASLTWNGHRGGYAGYAQADWEPLQGLHFMLTGEGANHGSAGEPSSFGGWASAAWFFAPHADARIDAVLQRFGSPGGDVDARSLLVQLHLYL